MNLWWRAGQAGLGNQVAQAHTLAEAAVYGVLVWTQSWILGLFSLKDCGSGRREPMVRTGQGVTAQHAC